MIKKIIVLGVSGSGKSLIGQQVADHFGYPFFDGDDFHSAANVEKMRQSIPLNDDDRKDWLITLNQLLIDNPTAVVACSGLKPKYRDALRKNLDDVKMVYLKGDIETIWARHQQRGGHFFNGRAMLESQFEALIEPTSQEAIVIDIAQDVNSVVADVLSALPK